MLLFKVRRRRRRRRRRRSSSSSSSWICRMRSLLHNSYLICWMRSLTSTRQLSDRLHNSNLICRMRSLKSTRRLSDRLHNSSARVVSNSFHIIKYNSIKDRDSYSLRNKVNKIHMVLNLLRILFHLNQKETWQIGRSVSLSVMMSLWSLHARLATSHLMLMTFKSLIIILSIQLECK